MVKLISLSTLLVSATSRALSPSRCPVGPTYRRRFPPRTRAFSRCPMGPNHQPGCPFACPLSLFHGPRLSVPPRTAHALRRGRAHDRAFPGHAPTRPSLFWSPPSLTRPPPLSCTLRQAPSPSLSLCAHAREARCGPPPVLWLPLSFYRAHCLGELRPFACNMGHLLVRPQPLWFALSALTGFFTWQTELCRHRPEASLRPCRCSSAPESPLKVNNSPTPLFPRVFPCLSRNCPPEWVCAAVGPLHRELSPLVPPRRCRACG
jgi:hypothetical protein